MKEIKTVGIIGLGALGTLFAKELADGFGRDRVLVLADADRIRRYETDGVYFNGQRCSFRYTDAASCAETLDLLIFATKFGALEASIDTCRHLVTPETTLVSILNGVTSEQVLGEAFSPAQVVWCVAQKMSARKEGNRVTVDPLGELALGVPAGMDTAHLDRLTAFFDAVRFPYSLPEDIRRQMWSKLLCNVGTNPTTMVFDCGYSGLQKKGRPREVMFAAMREVLAVANAEGIPLGEEDIKNWVAIVDAFPGGTTSMHQDRMAGRPSEVELFAGTICRYAAMHGLEVPTNAWLYNEVKRIEATYTNS